MNTNIEVIGAQIRDAAHAGAQYVQTPEVTTLMEARGAAQLAKSEPDGPENTAVDAFSKAGG